MPSTPTYGIPYPSLSDSPNGPAQMQALALEVENEITRVDARIATDETLLAGFAPAAQVASGTLNSAVAVTVASVVISDPGFSYHILVSGACGWSMTGASAPGNLFEGSITLDSATYNVNRIVGGFVVSHSLGAGFTQPTLILPVKRSDAFGAQTGAHTIRLIVRNSSAAQMNVTAAAVDTTLMVRIVRA